MFLSVGNVDPDKQLYAGQAGFQTFLVLIALLSVPVMLLVKPYYHKHLHEQAKAAQGRGGSSDEHAPLSGGEDDERSQAVAAHGDDHHGHGEFNFSDEMIHQGIHTIEFVLGCVSNTASYLRLWALSLAHAQLAKVFWDKMMAQYGYESGGFNAFIGFSVWFGATFAVLLCMDVLECFLHALRLHWVEFQSKFYDASGIAYEPFEFENFDLL
jgi:V-type H+-transporting ATPase subunit a